MKTLLKSVIVTVGLSTVVLPITVLADEQSTTDTSSVTAKDGSQTIQDDSIYVPKAEREGTFTGDLHAEDDNEAPIPDRSRLLNAKAAYPNVNNYIKSNNFKTSALSSQIQTQFTKFNYRNGYGKPEGVVLHETANPNSTIQNEIDYMSRNWENAFVHSFVDKGNIIQIHPTDYGVWGAGRFANARFVQYELVEHSTFDEFARSINNYAYYTAYILDKYKLPIDSAETDGVGTVWTHNAVSKYLGGTTHTDPIGYFNKWGYSYNEFLTLVTEKYNAMSKDTILSNVAFTTTTYANVKTASGNTVWSAPFNTAGSKEVNPLSSYNGKNMKLLRTAKTQSGTWYQFAIDGKTIGWVEDKAVNIFYTPSMESTANLTRYVSVPTESVYYFPVADASMRRGDLSAYINKPLKVNKQITINGKLWYYVINGSELVTWVPASSLTATAYDQVEYNKAMAVTTYANVKTATGNNVWTVPNGTLGAKVVNPLSTYNSKNLKLVREMKTSSGLWYQFAIDGTTIGWVDSKAVTITYTPSMETSANLTRYVNVPTESVYYFPVADASMRRGNLSAYINKPLKVHKQITINGKLWYYLINGSELVTWVPASSLKETLYDKIEYDKAMAVTTYANVKTASGNNIWTVPNGTSGAKVVNPLSTYNGKNLKLVREMKTSSGLWYQFAIDGKTIGWVDSKAITITYTPSMETPANLVRYVSVPTESVYYFPVADASMRRGDLAAYTNKPLKVHKQITINGKLWYYLINGSELVTWVPASSLTTTVYDQVEYNKAMAVTTYANVKTTTGNNVWTVPNGTLGAKVVNPLSNYNGKNLKLIREMKTSKGLWYQFAIDGKTIGWVDSKAITITYTPSMEKSANLTRYVSVPTESVYYFPVVDASMRRGNLSAYTNKPLKVHKQITINGKLWYYLINGSELVTWVPASSVR
ncbi:GW domain-containing glycosaminoglycan-binding protein [Listeria booriae]|uniref:N-acetylmuramoyl-L-alanine amidase n=1 Tax=Listeria booriae TaxID=1552123 RepID=A0A099W422_9LIST|nr:GW domain-containing glycosaminoglycan-binding protein [Listeria booriae]KGL38865.1 N-acetylmuramoyl-L-alanine amidase [Listeria booriae]STY45860.1 AtlE [Listeria booriae]